MPNDDTVAVPCTFAVVEGVEKPDGSVPMAMVAVPAPTGWKAVGAVELPAEKTTGLVVIVPAAVFELVTGTEMEPVPGLSGNPEDRTVKLPGFRTRVATVNVVLPDRVEVVKVGAALNPKPDGSTVTVKVAVVYPGAETVMVDVPTL